MNERINQLIDYALKYKMIEPLDVDYCVNRLLDLLKLDDFERAETKGASIYDILDDMLDYAVDNKLIEDTITARDLFDTRIMDCVMEMPSTINHTFNEYYKEDAKKATDYFYNLSIHSNYIRKSRTDKNIKFSHYYKYGDIQITINLSKPEKDPNDIAKAKLIKSVDYPQCALCKENVGFAGNLNKDARETHRIIKLDLNRDTYYLQYSPYVYYNEHCIVLNEKHVPMVINRRTFENLFAFLDMFPHYMIGSNADLPIVGGSILSHDHYQGGRHHFPIEDAKIIKEVNIKGYDDIKVEMLYWPLSTLRLTSQNKESLIDLSQMILDKWIDYSDESLGIIAYDEHHNRHNTITPIVRMKDNEYQIDIVLRNNRTTKDYPLGIFHPHSEHHHIKKENIGLIEVMGLAILPARLKNELEELKQCLLGKGEWSEELDKHKEWYEYLKTLDYNEETIDEMIEVELTKKFVMVLEDAGVFKMNKEGINGFDGFIETLNSAK